MARRRSSPAGPAAPAARTRRGEGRSNPDMPGPNPAPANRATVSRCSCQNFPIVLKTAGCLPVPNVAAESSRAPASLCCGDALMVAKKRRYNAVDRHCSYTPIGCKHHCLPACEVHCAVRPAESSPKILAAPLQFSINIAPPVHNHGAARKLCCPPHQPLEATSCFGTAGRAPGPSAAAAAAAPCGSAPAVHHQVGSEQQHDTSGEAARCTRSRAVHRPGVPRVWRKRLRSSFECYCVRRALAWQLATGSSTQSSAASGGLRPAVACLAGAAAPDREDLRQR